MLLKELVAFYTSCRVPRSALHVQPPVELSEGPRPTVPPCLLQSRKRSKEEIFHLLHLLPKPHCRPLLICTTHPTAGYQAGTFNSTTLTCDNRIPTSFLSRVTPGEEAVTTSSFHQSNPSLTSYQSGRLSSQCPRSLFSSSVTNQSQVAYLQRLLRCLSPTEDSLFVLYLPLVVVHIEEALAVEGSWTRKPHGFYD